MDAELGHVDVLLLVWTAAATICDSMADNGGSATPFLFGTKFLYYADQDAIGFQQIFISGCANSAVEQPLNQVLPHLYDRSQSRSPLRP